MPGPAVEGKRLLMGRPRAGYARPLHGGVVSTEDIFYYTTPHSAVKGSWVWFRRRFQLLGVASRKPAVRYFPSLKLMAVPRATQFKGSGAMATSVCKKLAKPAKPPKEKDNFTRPKRAVEVEAALKEVTGSEVHVEYKDGKGSLKIDFYSDDMLQKFVSLLGMYDPEG